MIYHRWAQRALLGEANTQPMVRFFGLNLALSQLANPFGILGAGLFVQVGLPVFLFFTSGMLVVAFLGRQLSWADERSRLQYQVLLQLEQLGNAVINMAPEDTALAEVLQPHLPTMFPAGNLVVWTFPDEVLYLNPENWSPDLSRTLLRTYAMDGELQPEAVIAAANERILADTSSNLFVTAFYGVLEPGSGRLTYSNAGHNPPYLVRGCETIPVQELVRTGIPIGVERDSRWGQSSLSIQPGDLLILYTDGIPEAQNAEGEFFTARLLLETIKKNLDRSAEAMQARILESIEQFVGEAPQADDITLMLIARDPAVPGAA